MGMTLRPRERQSKEANSPPGPNRGSRSSRNQPPSRSPAARLSGRGPPGATNVNAGNGRARSALPPRATTGRSSTTAASPSSAAPVSVNNNGTQTNGTTSLPQVPASFLTPEFMQSVASTLDDFDAQIFRTDDGGINLEDFREWFNPDDVANMR